MYKQRDNYRLSKQRNNLLNVLVAYRDKMIKCSAIRQINHVLLLVS